MNLPVPRKTLNIKQNQNGGFEPFGVITKIGLNDINIKNYYIESLDKQLSFRFTEKNKKSSAGNKYLGAGGITAVYSIALDSYDVNLPINYTNKIEKYKENLILRISKGSRINKIKDDVQIGDIDISNDEQSKFIEMWINHKNLFPDNIIDLFLYGDILFNGEYMGYYSITRVYGDENKIINLTFIERMLYLQNLYKFLIKLQDNGLTYRDLKIGNAGIDLDTFDYVVIDYDNVTIMKTSELIDLKQKVRLHYSAGTYVPIYFLENLKNNNIDINFDLLYLYGLFDIVQYLFRKSDFTNINYRKSIDLLFDLIKNIKEIPNTLYDLLTCIHKNQNLPKNCEGYVHAIIKMYNYINRDNIINRIKETINYINDITILNESEYILIILLCYILYPLVIDNYNEASKYSRQENYRKIIDVIDILINQYNDIGYKQKYLKYKMKYIKLKQNM